MPFELEVYAGFWRRLAASFIDMFILGLLAAAVHLLIFGDSGVELVPTDDGVRMQAGGDWFDQIIIAFATVIMWVKFLGTPGKLLLGCHVVDAETKQALTFPQAILRYVSYIVSLIPIGLGFFWIAWDKKKQGFHDKIAGSVVVLEMPLHLDDESQKSLEQLMDEVR